MALTDVVRRLTDRCDCHYERRDNWDNWGDRSVTRTVRVTLFGVGLSGSITTSMRGQTYSHLPPAEPTRVRVTEEPVTGPVYDGDGNVWERDGDGNWWPLHFYDPATPWWAAEKATGGFYVDAPER